MNNKTIEKIADEMANDILKVMEAIMDANDLQDSNIKKQMVSDSVESGNDIILRLFVNHYIYWIDQGRKPTNNPPIDKWPNPVGDIRDWCERKGIPSDNSTVYAIIRKIHLYGYEGRFFLEDFWRDAENETYSNLDKLFDAIIKDITDWFNK